MRHVVHASESMLELKGLPGMTVTFGQRDLVLHHLPLWLCWTCHNIVTTNFSKMDKSGSLTSDGIWLGAVKTSERPPHRTHEV